MGNRDVITRTEISFGSWLGSVLWSCRILLSGALFYYVGPYGSGCRQWALSNNDIAKIQVVPILTPTESSLYIRVTDPHLSTRIADPHHQSNHSHRHQAHADISTRVSNMMTEATSNSFIGSMQLNSAIPVPPMVTKSQTPYSGPDLVTALPTEIFQGIASNLDPGSI